MFTIILRVVLPKLVIRRAGLVRGARNEASAGMLAAAGSLRVMDRLHFLHVWDKTCVR